MLFWKFLHAFQGRGRQFYSIESFVVLNRFKERTNIGNMKQDQKQENGKKKMGKRSPRVWDLSYTLVGSQRRNDLAVSLRARNNLRRMVIFSCHCCVAMIPPLRKVFHIFLIHLKANVYPKDITRLCCCFEIVLAFWLDDFWISRMCKIQCGTQCLLNMNL